MSREDSIRFLRSLKGREAGVTIYQQVIDDVLGALDAAERERDEARESLRKAIRAFTDAAVVRDEAVRMLGEAAAHLRTWPISRTREAAVARIDALLARAGRKT